MLEWDGMKHNMTSFLFLVN